jgi:hypothetical protein
MWQRLSVTIVEGLEGWIAAAVAAADNKNTGGTAATVRQR